MKERTHSGRAQSIVDLVIYCAAWIYSLLFVIWFFVPIAAIRISGMTLAAILGALALFRWRLFLPYWQKMGSVAAAFEAVASASLASSFFTFAVLFGLLKGLSPATAFGVYLLAVGIPALSIAFFYWCDKKPRRVAVGILISVISLAASGVGIFSIYTHPSFTFTYGGLYWVLSGTSVGFIVNLVARIIRIIKKRY